jgi:CHAD domain-containing protein
VERPRRVEVDCEEPFAAAATRVVAARSQELFEQSAGILDLDDVERVHDMRVATRRLRAALELFETCFRPKRWRKALKRVRALADALGERRDVDVELELLEGLSGELAPGDRRSFEDLVDELRARQLEANERLAAFVTRKRLRKLKRRLRRLTEEAGR